MEGKISFLLRIFPSFHAAVSIFIGASQGESVCVCACEPEERDIKASQRVAETAGMQRLETTGKM